MIATISNIAVCVIIFLSLFTAFFWIISFYFEEPELHKRHKELKRYPTVSIILPAYNEESCIEETLKSLLNLDYPKDKLELIVVANNCKDRTVEIVKSFAKQGVKLIETPIGGKARAQNLGLKKAKGEIIVIADADIEVKPNALVNLLNPFENPDVALVVPAVIVQKPKNILQKIQHYEYLMASLIKRLMSGYNSLFLVPGAFNAYRTIALQKVGNFDENALTEDIEMATRLLKADYTVVSDINTKVSAQVPKTISGFHTQRLRWCRGFLEVMFQKHKNVLLNSKYGLFGSLIAPIMVLSPIIACILLSYITYWLILSAYNLVFLISLSDFSTMLRPFTSGYYVFNSFIMIPTIIVVAASLYIFIKANLHLKERLIGLPALLLFLFVYPFVLNFYWLLSMIMHYGKAPKVWRGSTRW